MEIPNTEKPEIIETIEARLRDEKLFLFDDKALRHAFIRKVFLIVCSQLVLSCLIIASMLLYEPVRKVIQEDRGIFISATVISWALYTSLICCIGISRSWPQNYIMLLFMTITASVAIGSVCVAYDFREILVAAGGCAILCFFLALCAFQTKFDLTLLGGSLLVFVVALVMLIILRAVAPSRTLTWVILVLGITLLSSFFMIDIQVIIRGKHRYSLTPDEYIVAAVLLYVDMLYIFIFVVLIIVRR